MSFGFILVYLVFQLIIGIVVSKKIKSEDDFLLAGRAMPTWLLAFSLFATWFGAETCIGTSAAVYEEGLAGSRADPFGYSLCLFLMGIFLAKKLWSGGHTTLADFYSNRYGHLVEKISVWVILPSSLIWGAAQIRAFGQIIASTSDLHVHMTMTIAFIFVVVYTLLGGLLGDILTDLIQGIIIIIGLVFLLYIVYDKNPDILNIIASQPERLTFKGSDETFFQRIDRWMIPIFGSLVTQELISRILSAKNANIAKNSAFVSGGIYIIFGSIPVLIGLIGPYVMPNLEDKEQFLILFAKNYMPTILFPIFIGALISAILATIDSILLAASALVSHNIIVPMFKIKNEKQKLFMARFTLVLCGFVAYVIALFSDGVYELVEMASSFGTAGILVITLAGLWSQWGGKFAASATLIVGILCMPISEHLLELQAPFLVTVVCCLFAFISVGWWERLSYRKIPR